MSTKKELIEFAKDKGIELSTQMKLSRYMVSEDKIFSELSSNNASMILTNFNTDGHTHWINAATGQNDITDGDQQAEDGKGEAAGMKQQAALSKVLDEESGQVMEVSEDMRRIAHNVQQRIEGATIITAFLIQLVRDEKLYLAFGCGSFKEYADTMLPFTRKTAYKYISIGEKFAPLLPNKLQAGSVASMRQLEEDLSSEDVVHELGGIGMSKLYELTKIPEAEFEEVLDKGVVKMPNGEEWSLEDIKSESSRKVAERVRETKKEYQKRISNLEEDKKKAREERDHYRDELEKNKDRIDRAQRLEQKYGAEAARMEEMEYLLDDTEAGLRQVESHFGKVDIGYSDPDEMKERAMSLMRRMTMQLEAARKRFEWLDDMDAFSAFPSWKLEEMADGNRETGDVKQQTADDKN